MKKFMKIVVMLMLFAVLSIFIVMLYFETSGGKEKKAELFKKGASEVISQMIGKDVDVQEFMDDNLSQEDADFVNEILEEKVDLNTVKNAVTEYQKTGTISDSIVNSLENSLTQDDKEKMMDLYLEYGDDFLNYIK